MPDDPGQSPLGKREDERATAGRQQNPLHGNSVNYILARLERDGRHDLVEAIRAGRVSAFAVAVELGWTARPENLGNGSGNQARRRRHQLSHIVAGGAPGVLSQMQELWLGPNPFQGSLFSSREELRAAWEKNRTEVMRLWGSHGRRPLGWYEFDAGDLERPPYDRERSTLWRAGVLSEAERTELEGEWRREFDAARGMGARARCEHFEHHDIPNELVEAWHAARRRCFKTGNLSG
jgi:hypothetical protein